MSASTPASSPSGSAPPLSQAAAAAADRAFLETPHRGLLLLAVILISIMQFIDATIANVALPHMKTALGASTDSVSWVLTSFLLATAIATPLTGWLSDRIGSRNLYVWATVLFIVTSALCGASTTLAQMVIFRTLQGVAAAFIGPMTLTIMFDISPPSKQAMTVAIFSLIVMVAPISGPTLGGLLVEYLNWRWIYYVNLPLGLPALALIWWLLPSREIQKRPLDRLGFAALAVGLCGLQLALDRGHHKDWLNSPEIVFELLIGASAFWVYVHHSRHARHPLFDRALFTNVNFMISLGSMTMLGVAVVGLSSVLPMLFQSLYGYPVMEAGMLMAPRGIGVMITSLLTGYLARFVDTRYLIAMGYLIGAGGMWYMTSWSMSVGTMPIVIASFTQGLGFGFVTSSMNMMAFATLAPEMRPEGSSLMSLFRSLGGSIGISVIVTMLSRNQQIAHADLSAHVREGMFPSVDLPSAVDQAQGGAGALMYAIDAEVSRQALMIAFLNDFYLLFWMLVAFAPLAFLLKKPPSQDAPRVPAAHE